MRTRTKGNFVHCSCVTLMFLGTGWLGTEAVAQVPGMAGQPQQREERPDLRSAAAREAEVYDPKGVRIGSFKFFPEIEADEVFNNNVNASQNARQARFVELISPSLALRSDWTNHMLNIYAKSGIGFCSVNGPQNNFQDGANGRLNIQRNWNVYGGTLWNRLHEVPGTPNTVTGPGVPVTVHDQNIVMLRLGARL